MAALFQIFLSIMAFVLSAEYTVQETPQFLHALLAGDLYSPEGAPPTDDLVAAEYARLVANRTTRLATHTGEYRIGLRTQMMPSGYFTPDPADPWDKKIWNATFQPYHTVCVVPKGEPEAPEYAFADAADYGFTPSMMLTYMSIRARQRQIHNTPRRGFVTRQERQWDSVLEINRLRMERRFLVAQEAWRRRRHILTALRP